MAFLDVLRKGRSYREGIASDRSDDSHFVVSHSSENSRLWLTTPQNCRAIQSYVHSSYKNPEKYPPSA